MQRVSFLLFAFNSCILSIQKEEPGIRTISPHLPKGRPVYCYDAAHIKRVSSDMRIEDYDKLKLAAAAGGESINGYIKKAIDERMERDGIE